MAAVLIVDDSEIDRRVAGGLLEADADLRIEYASDGADALARIRREAPDLVVTDLQMPNMDGLELVNQLHIAFPRVPVVLMTAHGSESIAAQALERGAASYVPKSRLAQKLHETIRDVLALSSANRTYERLIECSTRTQFEFRLDNDMALIGPLVDLVRQMVSSMGICGPSEQLQVGVAVEQAIQNAIHHGNLEMSAEDARRPRPQRDILAAQRRTAEPFSQRRVHVGITITRDEARFTIRDEGRGVPASGRPGPGEPLDPNNHRGLTLMRTFMDDVAYNERGNEVTMVKRRTRSSAD